MSSYNKEPGFDAMKRAEYDFDRAREALKIDYHAKSNQLMLDHDRALEQLRAAYDNQRLLIRRAG